MSAYAERRKGKLTGKWIGEAVVVGDRFRKRFETRKEAERWADMVKLTGREPDAEGKPGDGPTYGDVLQEARDAKTEWLRGRDHALQQRLDYTQDALGASTPIKNITTASLDKMVATLRKRPGQKGKLAHGTINRYLSAASSVLTFARERGHIPSAPTIPWLSEAGRRFLWLSDEQEAAIVAHMQAAGSPASVTVLKVLIATGMRWGELAGLEVGQVDIRNADAWVRLWETKTDSPRSIPITHELARELRALLSEGALPKYNTFRMRLKNALESAGQSREFCIHSLRHTTATRLIQRGVSLPVVKKYLGHSNINTTMRYVQVADEDLAKAAIKLSPRAGQSTETTLENAL
jgi:integrase